MAIEITIPSNLWDTDSEAVITSWFMGDGARVEKGALVAEVMTEKIQFEIIASSSGTLSIKRVADDIVKKGDVIGEIT
jgi:pyruvate/2-oxoglutarate dehydrogenase complex dihydrolipoamide acyltransferase (E2) component